MLTPQPLQDSGFAQFLSTAPLYSKIIAVQNFNGKENMYAHPLDFEKKPFPFKCPNEKAERTFITHLQISGSYFGRYNFSELEKYTVPMFFDEQTQKLNLIVYLIGVCQYCKKEIGFLLRAWSDKPWREKDKGITIYLEKIGQWPAFEIGVDKVMERFLTPEDLGFYQKARICLSQNYGIAAYAYFRRIVENEIIRIVEDITRLDYAEVTEVKKAYDQFLIDHQMSKLISSIQDHLPQDFEGLGDNPIKLLYEQLSSGIHNYPEDVCLEKAKGIDVILIFVIRRIHERKTEQDSIKNALRQLRS